MSTQPGYHPTCVLFQGNDCVFDGTYRLVCRHQIRPKDFQPGDNVEVDMGYDDDDDRDATEQDTDDIIIEGARWRDAIVLGDEMVMSLLRNMCKNQPTGRTPWSISNKQGKRKEDQRDTDAVRSKRIKTEECTTSQGAVDRVEGRPRQDDHLLRSILSAIHSVQAAQNLVTSELCHIKQGQQLLGEQVTAMQKTLDGLGDTVDLCDTASESEQAPTPISLFVSAPHSSRTPGSNTTSSGQMVSSPEAQAVSSLPSTSSTSSHPEIMILNPRSQAQLDLSTYLTHDQQDLSPSRLPPLYPIEDTPETHPHRTYNYHFTDNTQTSVFLGYPSSPVTLDKHEIDTIVYKTNNPTAFAYRLAGKIFTNEELFNGSISGKTRSGKAFKQLNLKYVDVILLEVAARFPTFHDTEQSTRKLRAAIDERCRNERKKVIYQCANPSVTI